MTTLNVFSSAVLAATAVSAASFAQVQPVAVDAERSGMFEPRAPSPAASSPQPASNPGVPQAHAPSPRIGNAKGEAPAAPAAAPGDARSQSRTAGVTASAGAPVSQPQRTVNTTGGAVDASSGEARVSGSEVPGTIRQYRFFATLDVANVLWRSGRGYDLFAERDGSWRLGAAVGYDALRLPERFVLAVEAGFLHEPEHGDNLRPVVGSLSGSLSASTIQLGPSLRWSMLPWLAPYARLGLLASSTRMDLESNSNMDAANSTSWSHQKWTPGGFMGLGAMATLAPRNPVNVGLLLEGGLWLQRSVDIRLERDLPSDAIATSGARIGKLENTGPYLRVAGVLRF